MNPLRVVSLFAGIGGFDLAFKRAGAQVVASVEIDEKARSVTRRHFPGVKQFNDVKDFNRGSITGTVDVVCGGSPCQDFSVAGLRAGLAGKRSGLWWEFARIIDEFEPREVIFENVPGILSSCGCATCGACRRLLRIHRYLRTKRQIHQPCPLCVAAQRLVKSHRGRDYAVILRWLVERGYRVAGRVLDAQNWGVAQRRRRVFLVASLGTGRCAEILFESDGLFGDTPSGRSPRPRLAADVASSVTARSRQGSTRSDRSDNVVSAPLVSRQSKGSFTDPKNDNVIAVRLAQTSSNGWGVSEDGTGGDAVVISQNGSDVQITDKPGALGAEARGTNEDVIAFAWQQGVSNNDRSYPVRAGDYAGSVLAHRVDAVAFQQNQRNEVRELGDSVGALNSEPGMHNQNFIIESDIAATLNIGGNSGGFRTEPGEHLVFQPRYFTRDNKTGCAPSELPDITNAAKAGDSAPVVFESRFARNGRGAPEDLVPPLKAQSGETSKGDSAPLVAFQSSQSGVRESDTHATLDGNNGSRRHNGVVSPSFCVRRLTPVECERLQGFLDGWTEWGVDESGQRISQADSTRYRQLGNAVAVPVVEWLARRLVAVEAQRAQDKTL